MAYTKVSNKEETRSIKYLNKDFTSFKNQLIEYAEVYFPNHFNDFSEGNPGMMFMEMASYVGDVLSFYTDTQLRESFISTAQERENIYNLSYTMGYKPKVTSTSVVNLDLFQLIPSKDNGSGIYIPDYNYALDILENSTFSSTEGVTFYTDEITRFGVSSSMDPTEINIYQYDNANNPQYYLLKKKTKAISAEVLTKTFNIGDVEQFKTLTLFNNNIVSIESIKDSEGNDWTEVPYLAQDTVFDSMNNTAANDPELYQYNNQTPFLLKMKKVPKRFVTRFKSNRELEIQFGSGAAIEGDTIITPDPNNIGLGIKDGRSKLDVAYDPSNFLYTKSYGEAPSNTTLTVKYLVGGGFRSNVSSNTITTTGKLLINPKANIDASLFNFAKGSVAVNNSEPARGGGSGDTIDEIRMNTMASFSAQSRTVTKNDYIVRSLSMPSRFGRIAKAYITQDNQITPYTGDPTRIPNPLALNLYTLGYNENKQLSNLNSATKTNLSTYLEQFRMLTDAINIKNAYIINFGIDFEITTFKNYNNQEVLLNCITELQNYFNIDKWQVNQPIIISEIENLIGGVLGVQTVDKVDIKNLNSDALGYSIYRYDFKGATKKGVIYPSMDPSIFELKYPNEDINGRVITY
tara:strand:+ start:4453 stop:6348 length:1896 start_codon:yes stop_codon:yes gene_type:complete